MSARRLTIAAVAALLVLALGGGTAEAAKAPSPKAQVKRAFKQLVKATATTPRRAVSKRHRRALVRTLNKARRQAKHNPCKAVKTLKRYRRGLRGVHEPKAHDGLPTAGSFRAQLQAGLLGVNIALKQLPKARRCGGGKPSKVTEPTAKVVESDENHLRLKVALPPPTFASQQVNGTDFQQMFMEGMGQTGDVGEPGLPTVTEYFGVPNGAGVALKINGTSGYTVGGVDLFPHQPQPADLALPPGAPAVSTFADKPFEIDNKVYDSNDGFPARPADAGGLGSLRALTVGGVDLAGGVYHPKSNDLKVFTSIDVTINFNGDNKGTFGSAELKNPWSEYFNRTYNGMFTNYGTVLQHLPPDITNAFCGSEMLVITSPALEPAANTFKAAKQAQGYSTRVAVVGGGAGQIGTTNVQIQSFIRAQLTNHCRVHPTYVVLLGNTAAVPTWLVPCGPGGDPNECNIASDLPYSLDGLSSDLFADVQLGRIPATDLPDANGVVDKIINYENNMPAPAGDDFYHHATTTSYFQPATHCVLNEGETGTPNCDEEAPPVNAHWEVDHSNHQDTRGFTKTAEAVNVAMRAQGYAVDRLYTTDDSDVIPETYYDGTSIPSHLRRPTFAWDANTTDFLNAYNAGRFLILHRDHGWPDGWAEPTIHSGHVPGFTNGTKLPVVFGVNCASAAFDTPDHPSFVELQVRRIGGGAVAGFGDTRNSPSFPNNHMTRGFFDAMFPNLQPEFGSPTPTRRLGEVLVRGKQFMASQEGIDWQGAGDTYVEHFLYHLLGDPSLQMWADPPHHFVPPDILTRYRALQLSPGDPRFEVEVKLPIGGGEPPAFNTVATLLHDGDPIGRAIVGRDGTATIRPEIPTDSEHLTVSYQQDGVLPATDSVDDAPPRTATSLTLQVNGSPSHTSGGDFSGKLDPGFAGASVRIVYTPEGTVPGDPRSSFERTATTAADGSWADHAPFPFNVSNFGTNNWSARAYFDGDLDHAPSASNTVQFTVGD